MKTAVKNTATAKTANPRTTTKITQAVKAVKVDKTVYLAEGVTGKAFMQLIFNANKAHKEEGKSFSFCLKRAVEFGGEVFSSIKGFDIKDLTPANLIPLRSEHNKLKAGFSVYEVLMLIKKYYQNK